MYWALDPAAVYRPLTPECWEFLLGEHRCAELTLAGRLSAHFNPYCCPAIASTIRLRQSVAGNQRWRQTGRARLPIPAASPPERAADTRPESVRSDQALRAGQELAHYCACCGRCGASLSPAVISLALVIAVITLTAEGSSTAFVKSLLGVLGAVGLTAAAFKTRLKNTAQSLLTRFQQNVYTDLVAGEMGYSTRQAGRAPARRTRHRGGQ